MVHWPCIALEELDLVLSKDSIWAPPYGGDGDPSMRGPLGGDLLSKFHGMGNLEFQIPGV